VVSGRPREGCKNAHERGSGTSRCQRTGVVTAAPDADLLIMARDGDRPRLGPKSLGKAARFVIDHAPCPVLLVWPEPHQPSTPFPRRLLIRLTGRARVHATAPDSPFSAPAPAATATMRNCRDRA
jgi:hypothetical protein